MKTLFVGSYIPYPLHGGGQNLIYHWLEATAARHDVHLLVISDQNRAFRSIPGLPGVQIHFQQVDVSRTPWGRAVRQGASLLRSTPATSLVLMTAAVQDYLKELVRRHQFDAVILAENGVAGFAPVLRSMVPVVLLKHSVHVNDAIDARRRSGRFHPRWILEERIARRFEARTCRAATVVCCVNPEDTQRLISRYKLSNPVVPVPLGVDPTQFPNRGVQPDTKVIGFTGNLTWGANIDAVHWLCREVLPRVWRTHPDAKLLVIGPGGESMRTLYTDPRIEFTGRVPSVPEAMRQVSVGVVPIVSGTGMRCKLLDMLSMGIPAISTTLGTEGLDCVSGEHLLIADTGDAFAKSLQALLADAELRHKLAVAGAKLVSAYSWPSIYPKVLETIDFSIRRYHEGATIGIGSELSYHASPAAPEPASRR